MESELFIILPEKISILRDRKKQDICVDKEELSIYYKNIIYPYKEEYDIQIDCLYGKNMGHCWRINEFSNDTDEFDFTIMVFKEFGQLIAKKSCRIQIIEKNEYDKCHLLCIGDSMTRAEIYIQQAVNKARNVNTIGLRNIAMGVNHEGRGGWTSHDYLERYSDAGNGVSPFLFPIGYEAKEYFGDKAYWERVNSSDYCTKYSYAGIAPQHIVDGMLCLDDGILYRYSNGQYVVENKNPKFEFSFGKYIERYNLAKPNIVSLLFGANEFQHCSYGNLNEEIEKYICSIREMVASIKEFDKDIKIIVNLPVCGGDQYSWGNALGCKGSAKQYNYCIKMASKVLIETFEKENDEGIFICPMLAVCDTDAGFPWDVMKSNIYSDKTEIRCTNWIHPSEVGYKQMGDALAAVIATIR